MLTAVTRPDRRYVAGALSLLFAAGCRTGDQPSAGGTATTVAQASRTSVKGSTPASGVPETFLAVRDVGTEIVEVETATGRVRRTVVDYGPYRESETNTSIESLDISPDGSTLYYGTLYQPAVGSIYRLQLPDGEPERVGDGRGPSVSADGRRLAFVLGSSIHIRDLRTGQDQVFRDMTGIGGGCTSWAGDSASRNIGTKSHAKEAPLNYLSVFDPSVALPGSCSSIPHAICGVPVARRPARRQ